LLITYVPTTLFDEASLIVKVYCAVTPNKFVKFAFPPDTVISVNNIVGQGITPSITDDSTDSQVDVLSVTLKSIETLIFPYWFNVGIGKL